MFIIKFWKGAYSQIPIILEEVTKKNIVLPTYEDLLSELIIKQINDDCSN